MEKTVKGSKVFTPEYILEIREGNYTKDEATTKILHECGQTRFPINPWQIARKLNFKVLEASFRNKSISGMMIDALEVPDVLKPFGSKRAIILNKDESKQMQSFKIEHELAHFVYDCNEQSNCFDAYHVSRDKGEHELNEGEQEEKKREDDMDEFAAKLLMPEILFREYINNSPNRNNKEILTRELARVCMVEETAVDKRYEELDISFI